MYVSPHIYEIVTATTNLVDIFQTGIFQRNSMEKNYNISDIKLETPMSP